MKTLHEKFIQSSFSNRPTIEDIGKHMVEVYKAKLIGKEAIKELKEDPCVNFDRITHCFAIPEEVVDNLRSPSEKVESEKSIKLILQYGSLSDDEKERVINQEKGITLILESADQQYVDNFTIQGESEKLLEEMICLQGIAPAEYNLGNENYVAYLNILHRKGLI